MFRSLSVAAAVALTTTLSGTSTAPPTAPPTAPSDATGVVEDLVFPVEDVIGAVESLDGSESETKQGTQVTVALTSDVLFAVDKWVLTAKARQRLKEVAAKVNAEGAGGVVKIEGHTDDQGADAYNVTLSQRRAGAVEQVMRGLLTGADVTIQAKGWGESRPKLPNVVEGKPVPANRERNRRVEIVYNVKQ
ncbi:OmpA family protein [Nonomuraea sp. NPDC048916]|uniref:OmpA family protein n=1 Tax=Nonomuraea sp. NPDC048916 TaxID=3154232 RepID=UPI00340BDD9C